MSMAVDFTTAIGQVRAHIGDTTDDPILTDPEIQAMLDVAQDNVYAAIASALRRIATETALLMKYVRTDDMLVDGTKTADSLLKSAAEFEGRAKAYDSGAYFEILGSGYTLEDPWASLEVI